MYECSSCAAQLRFDIDTQMLKCDSCGNTYSPNEYVVDGKGAEKRESFETHVYTCPQCAGEIAATNTTATTFCVYCGATVVLQERIQNQLKPKAIIPFKKSKNHELTDEEKKIFIDKFQNNPKIIDYIAYYQDNDTKKRIKRK